MSEFFPFAVLIGVAILEIILSGSWSSPYFRYGIPVYSETVQFYAATTPTAISKMLSESMPRG